MRAPALAPLLALVLALAGVACGGDDPSPAGGADGGGGADAGSDTGLVVVPKDASSNGADAAAPDVVSCPPLAKFCLDERSWAVCNSAGNGHGDVKSCADSTLCVPDEGVCRVPFCQPNARECLGYLRYRECDPYGSAWEEPRSCSFDGSTMCVDGECKACPPNAAYCPSPIAKGQCNAAGTTYQSILPCLEGLACHELTGQCEEPVCAPGATACASATTYRYCLPSGTGYDTEILPCAPEHLCLQGKCTLEGCVPAVMLLVDRSGSMVPHWGAVRASVKAVVAANPKAIFGIIPFPTLSYCGVTTNTSLPLNYHSAAALDAWFDKWDPEGATPLAFAMQSLVNYAPQVFGGSGGALVVLSDGQDTCVGGPVTPPAPGLVEGMLSDAAARLRDEYGVSTYVIGYNYAGPTSQLEAIAGSGGTDLGTWIAAGSEAELTNAFKAVIDDFKLCVPSGSP